MGVSDEEASKQSHHMTLTLLAFEISLGKERDREGDIGDDECEHAKILASSKAFVALLSCLGVLDGICNLADLPEDEAASANDGPVDTADSSEDLHATSGLEGILVAALGAVEFVGGRG
jgi:hypothetical protein